MKFVCACEMSQIPQATSHQQQSTEHEGCHGHEEQSSEPTHHACICIDHGDEGIIMQVYQTTASSLVIAEMSWVLVDLFPYHPTTELFVYYHSPPSSRPLYLTQATLLL